MATTIDPSPTRTRPRATVITAAPDSTRARVGIAVALLTLLAAGTSVALLAALFWSAITHMVYMWSSDENYSHGFLVPLISVYFASLAAKHGGVERVGGVLIGSALLIVCILGRLATQIVPLGIVSELSMLAGLAGIVALLFGRRALRRYAFPLAFLVFMIPLPIALYTAIASPLQHLVSLMATRLLNVAGIPVLCHGNTMTLPGDVQLFVAEACSGMRQLTGFLALTTAVAWLTRRSPIYRIILILSSIPIAITANVMRVSLTAWLAYAVNPSLASGQFHTIEGLLLMGVGLALLWAECQVLAMVFTPSAHNVAPATA